MANLPRLRSMILEFEINGIFCPKVRRLRELDGVFDFEAKDRQTGRV